MHPSFCLHPLPSSTESIAGNKSLTFLITLDRDLGDLMMLKMHMEASALWRNVWDRVQTMIPWGSPEMKPQLTMGRISVKDGEMQERYDCAVRGAAAVERRTRPHRLLIKHKFKGLNVDMQQRDRDFSLQVSGATAKLR